ncbi:sensor histidine kinase [Massilia scottii]|uniref:sensor histidine kinase n=1 Tax=Massilia scottii TaxID=3057166 RepID=UPI0027969F02|nr:sensor histidine kinase [Massilia sp. CCM 9029]MDQ1829310.1 triple tyrosine motif-containing protein [Massilia sp. CCM 9029]
MTAFRRWQQRALAVLLALATVLPATAAGTAATPSAPLPQVKPAPAQAPAITLHHSSWTARDGAPTIIFAMAQSPDGWLWLGASTGLYRFDGVKFERYAPRTGSLASPGVSALLALPSGELWIGYRSGGVGLLKDGALRHFGSAEGMPPSSPHAIRRDAQGRIWLAGKSGLFRLNGERWEKMPGFEKLANQPQAMLSDSRGRFWVGNVETAFVLEPGASAFRRLPNVLDLSGNLIEAPDGTIWSNGGRNDSLEVVDQQPLGTARFRRVGGEYSSHMLFDAEGERWLLRREGVERSFSVDGHAVTQRLTPQQGLSGYIVFTALEDREGNIWVASNSGLDRFRRTKLDAAALPLYYGGEARALAAADNGAVWTDGFFVPGARSVPIPAAEMPSNGIAELTCLYRDNDGIIWAGGHRGVSYLDGKTFTKLVTPPDTEGRPVHAIAREADGTMWISFNGGGVYERRDGEWRKVVPYADYASRGATSVTAMADGQLWLGYIGNRIALREQGKLRLLGAAEGLQVGVVFQVYRHDSQTWIGGDSGVAYFDGKRFHPLLGVNDEKFMGVSGIVASASGQLWLNGSEGISVIDAAELKRAVAEPDYRVRFVRYDQEDGLTGTAPQMVPVPSAVAGSDGRLWFTTANSVVSVDPARLRRNLLAPHVEMRGVTVEGQNYPARDGLRLPAGTQRLQLDYTALSLSMPERVAFRFRLEGQDAGWTSAGPRRSAFFTGMGPGEYRFQVQASNQDGVWSNTGAIFQFSIAPTMTQTVWFRAACVLLALGLLWALYRWRMRQLASRIQGRLQVQVDERERIARELHDTLLQGVQALILRFHMAATKVGAQEPVRQLMDSALDQAELMLQEGRDQVHDLRAHDHFQADMAGMLQREGQRMAEERGVQFALREAGRVRALPPLVAHEVYRIANEAMLNAFKHAKASKIEVELLYERKEMTVVVRDNGCGLPAEVLRDGGLPGHWGLPGISERAERLGANVRWTSAPGQGSEMRLRLPGTLLM